MKNVIIFFSGVAIGIAGTALWMMKKLVPELREEAARQAHEDIHQIQDYSEYAADDESAGDRKDEEESEEDDIPEPPKAEMKKAVQENRETPSVDYSRYAETAKSEVKEKPDEPRPSTDNDANTGPYVIDATEYDTRGGYRSHSYTIYVDGIIVDDESGKTMTFDPKRVFGKTAMDELEKEGVVYVRDDDHKRDYRVEQMDFEYDGPDPEDDDDWGL